MVTHLDSGPRNWYPLCGARAASMPVTYEIDDVTCTGCIDTHEQITRDEENIITDANDAFGYLTARGNLDVPCSRYGRDTDECAPVAWNAARAICDAAGEYVTVRDLNYAMSLVVNNFDDIANLMDEYPDYFVDDED